MKQGWRSPQNCTSWKGSVKVIDVKHRWFLIPSLIFRQIGLRAAVLIFLLLPHKDHGQETSIRVQGQPEHCDNFISSKNTYTYGPCRKQLKNKQEKASDYVFSNQNDLDARPREKTGNPPRTWWPMPRDTDWLQHPQRRLQLPGPKPREIHTRNTSRRARSKYH